jgi:hypothetical protein
MKYHNVEPPPVLALPRDLQHLHPSRLNDLSLVTPVVRSLRSPSRHPLLFHLARPSYQHRPNPPRGPNHLRPSTTTRSSSLVSSDVVSSKFFYCKIQHIRRHLSSLKTVIHHLLQNLLSFLSTSSIQASWVRLQKRLRDRLREYTPLAISPFPFRVWIMKIGQSFARLRSSYLCYPFSLFVALLST